MEGDWGDYGVGEGEDGVGGGRKVVVVEVGEVVVGVVVDVAGDVDVER